MLQAKPGGKFQGNKAAGLLETKPVYTAVRNRANDDARGEADEGGLQKFSVFVGFCTDSGARLLSVKFVCWCSELLQLALSCFCPRHHVCGSPQSRPHWLGKRSWKLAAGHSSPYAALAPANHVC